MMYRNQTLLVAAIATMVLFVGGAASAQMIASDNFDSYNDGTDALGLPGHNSNPPWLKRGDTSGFDLNSGVVGRTALPVSGSATAYYGGHTHTTEDILRAEIELTIPDASPSPETGFWGSFYLALHQTPGNSGPPFPPLSNSYLFGIRGTQDFNFWKYGAGNTIEINHPAPAGDPGGGGWTNFNGFATTPSNHNVPAGNLEVDTTYIMSLERNATNMTITAKLTRKDNGNVAAMSSFVDTGTMHTGGHASFIHLGGAGGGAPASYEVDNFALFIPEPSSFMLVTMAGLALFCRHRRR